MTRLAGYLLPTEKQAPTDAEAISHKLMVRAGLIRQVGSGLWSWLPAGWRVHRKVVEIIRQEMDAIGSQEMLMPVLQPADLWKQTGRAGISELFKLHDRKLAELVLAMTHEEVVTSHVAQVVRSYRDLPLMLYHIQLKERDEPRPRAGVLRTREFTMKDAYTFDRDSAGLDVSYEKHTLAYQRIFERTGLRWYRVDADVGMMGGTGAHEYMAPCPAGENDVALAPGYAANVEVATADPQPVALPDSLPAPQPVDTPGLRTVAEVSAALGLPPGALLKAFPVIAPRRGLVVVLVRGDHRVNPVKLTNALGETWRPASTAEIADRIGPVGFIGPVGIDAPILLDGAVAPGGYVTGANLPDTHLRGVQPDRDFPCERSDIRSVEPGDLIGGNPISIEPAIEVGNIFKLGTRYSEPLGASFLDENGQEQFVVMGSYGLGPARIAAAAVEQFADDRGISWPRAIAPFDVHLVAVGKTGTPERELAETVYAALRDAALDVVFDDREIGPGQKFADADLLGCPLRLTVGKRSLESGLVEIVRRRGQESLPGLPLDGLADAVRALWLTAP
ncbi:MAG: prolyl-tRNA synthetase [Solirubrobacteraceae bacterium]|jgi:prolyl-tRNA synthetase|nr:prolyl-tRNA synthetase [Solirubrobacteraceae bacterium]